LQRKKKIENGKKNSLLVSLASTSKEGKAKQCKQSIHRQRAMARERVLSFFFPLFNRKKTEKKNEKKKKSTLFGPKITPALIVSLHIAQTH
jgi:hypothetical protein